MSNIEELSNSLKCPITLDFFEDPVTVPCCGQAVSRLPLVQCLESNQWRCPLCMTELPANEFNPLTAAKNVNIAGMVDQFLINNNNGGKVVAQKWSSTVVPLVNPQTGEVLQIGELNLELENSNFVAKPSLIICAVDKSGSMAGSSWKQVQTALIHIMGLAKTNKLVKVVIIAYDSNASEINTTGSAENVQGRIAALKAGGGTNFKAAFNQIEEVLSNFTCSDAKELQYVENNVSNVTIAFLTDGQSSGNRDELVAEFKDLIQEKWTNRTGGPLAVHAIGFGSGCDQVFLEKMWKTGSIDGTYRYAEPSDDGDTLCHKLQSLFDVAAKSSIVRINVKLNGLVFHSNGSNEHTINFPINKYRKGRYRDWVVLDNGDENKKKTVTINSLLDKNVDVPVNKIYLNTMDVNYRNEQFEKWVSKSIDTMASELMELVKVPIEEHTKPFHLHCAILQQRFDKMMTCSSKDELIERLTILSYQLKALRNGAKVNVGKIGDLRFGSQFKKIKVGPKKNVIMPRNPVQNKQLKIKAEPEYSEMAIRYSQNSENGNRNALQKFIIDYKSNKVTIIVKALIDSIPIETILHEDDYGNNVIHICALCGQNKILEAILQKFSDDQGKINDMIDINKKNKSNETPLTIAIKKQGFWKVMKVLIKEGAEIPDGRAKALEEFSINNGFVVTGKMLGGVGDSAKEVNHSMTSEYVEFLYEMAMENEIEINTNSYLDVALAKQMSNFVKVLIKEHGAVPTIWMLLDHCIPKKPDSPETDRYLDLVKLVINANSALIFETNGDGETALFKAAEKGSLPHVKYFILKKSEIDSYNVLGNTPLWIACAKRYPCIIEELLNNGANVNRANIKGNVPLYGICQMGPKKIAEQLLSFGATVYHKNKNGDTLILICCRNGQHETLEVLLDHVDEEFVDFKADIDGFNAIMASAEADRPECIRVLKEYGVDLEQKTEETNEIIASATPLHIAAYYNRIKAAQALITLGANHNSIDKFGQTPLHTAVIQGNIEVIKILRNNGCDIGIQDVNGNTPASYCRNNVEIKDVLIDPAIDILMDLSKGGFTTVEERQACEILMQHTGQFGIMLARECIDIAGQDYRTPLMQAIIFSKFNLVSALIQLGADPNKKDSHGLSSYFWAKQINNPRITRIVEQVNEIDPEYTLECLNRVVNARKDYPQSASLLFFANKPKSVVIQTSSGISSRMEDFINSISTSPEMKEHFDSQMNDGEDGEDGEDGDNDGNDEAGESIKPINNRQLVSLVEKDCDEDKQAFYDCLFWNARIFTISKIASGQTILNPYQIMCLTLFTSNPIVPSLVNGSIISKTMENSKEFIRCLYDTIRKSVSYEGEVYIGSNNVDRSLFSQDTIVSWPTFMSTSTLWRVATEHVEEFATKKKQGTIFIVQSKTGKHIGQHSQFSYDSEVMFAPNTHFRVTNWYRGDVICLGQANIREHTFKLKDEEIGTMMNTNKSLIIELTEV
jgi:ankyrin repeat protein/uncharacterized protein YegL